MSKIVEDANVVTIIDGKMVQGTVLRVHEELDLAIVQMEDGSVHKVKRNLLSILEKEKPVVEEPKEEPKPESNEGVKVITKEQFKKAVFTVTSPETIASKIDKSPSECFMRGMSSMLVGMSLSERLFESKEEIEISRDQLVQSIVDGCRPSAVSEGIDGKMSSAQVLPIAILAGIILTDIPKILFDDSENV